MISLQQPIQISFDFAGRRVILDEKRVSNTKKQVPHEVKQESQESNISGYYLEPTKDTSVTLDSHIYKNNTLNGKANNVYEVNNVSCL